MPKILLDIPDDLFVVLALKQGTPESVGSIEDDIRESIQKGLEVARTPYIAPEDMQALVDDICENIRRLEPGTEFTLKEILGERAIHPNSRKVLGKRFAALALDAKLFSFTRKNQQNSTIYVRNSVPGLDTL